MGLYLVPAQGGKSDGNLAYFPFAKRELHDIDCSAIAGLLFRLDKRT